MKKVVVFLLALMLILLTIPIIAAVFIFLFAMNACQGVFGLVQEGVRWSLRRYQSFLQAVIDYARRNFDTKIKVKKQIWKRVKAEQ
jgi:ABC-type spermidine/putrescine transport system permease subunit II